jgi:enoyl-CoA hydratase/carnithine racemase
MNPSTATGTAPLQLQRIGPRAVQLLLNRPAQRNPLDWDTVRALRDLVAEVEADADVSVVRVRGAGGHFSAGGDLKAYVGLYQRPDDFRRFLEDFYLLLDAIERSSKLYIALVEGYCVAGGLELLLACDLVLAPRSARIGDGHLNFGQLPGAGGSQRLPRTIGPARARWLIASGEFIDAAEAERFGLVSKVFDDELFDQEVDKLTERLTRHSPLGLSGMKHLVNEGLRGHVEAGLKMEIDFVHRYATQSHDATEGLLAFAEKRPPRFRGS